MISTTKYTKYTEGENMMAVCCIILWICAIFQVLVFIYALVSCIIDIKKIKEAKSDDDMEEK